MGSRTDPLYYPITLPKLRRGGAAGHVLVCPTCTNTLHPNNGVTLLFLGIIARGVSQEVDTSHGEGKHDVIKEAGTETSRRNAPQDSLHRIQQRPFRPVGRSHKRFSTDKALSSPHLSSRQERIQKHFRQAAQRRFALGLVVPRRRGDPSNAGIPSPLPTRPRETTSRREGGLRYAQERESSGISRDAAESTGEHVTKAPRLLVTKIHGPIKATQDSSLSRRQGFQPESVMNDKDHGSLDQGEILSDEDEKRNDGKHEALAIEPSQQPVKASQVPVRKSGGEQEKTSLQNINMPAAGVRERVRLQGGRPRFRLSDDESGEQGERRGISLPLRRRRLRFLRPNFRIQRKGSRLVARQNPPVKFQDRRLSEIHQQPSLPEDLEHSVDKPATPHSHSTTGEESIVHQEPHHVLTQTPSTYLPRKAQGSDDVTTSHVKHQDGDTQGAAVGPKETKEVVFDLPEEDIQMELRQQSHTQALHNERVESEDHHIPAERQQHSATSEGERTMTHSISADHSKIQHESANLPETVGSLMDVSPKVLATTSSSSNQDSSVHSEILTPASFDESFDEHSTDQQQYLPKVNNLQRLSARQQEIAKRRLSQGNQSSSPGVPRVQTFIRHRFSQNQQRASQPQRLKPVRQPQTENFPVLQTPQTVVSSFPRNDSSQSQTLREPEIESHSSARLNQAERLTQKTRDSILHFAQPRHRFSDLSSHVDVTGTQEGPLLKSVTLRIHRTGTLPQTSSDSPGQQEGRRIPLILDNRKGLEHQEELQDRHLPIAFGIHNQNENIRSSFPIDHFTPNSEYLSDDVRERLSEGMLRSTENEQHHHQHDTTHTIAEQQQHRQAPLQSSARQQKQHASLQSTAHQPQQHHQHGTLQPTAHQQQQRAPLQSTAHQQQQHTTLRSTTHQQEHHHHATLQPIALQQQQQQRAPLQPTTHQQQQRAPLQSTAHQQQQHAYLQSTTHQQEHHQHGSLQSTAHQQQQRPSLQSTAHQQQHRPSLQSTTHQQQQHSSLQSTAHQQQHRPSLQSTTHQQQQHSSLQSTAHQQQQHSSLQSTSRQQQQRPSLQSTAHQQQQHSSLQSTAHQQQQRPSLQSTARQQQQRLSLQSTAHQQQQHSSLQSTAQQQQHASLQPNTYQQHYQRDSQHHTAHHHHPHHQHISLQSNTRQHHHHQHHAQQQQQHQQQHQHTSLSHTHLDDHHYNTQLTLSHEEDQVDDKEEPRLDTHTPRQTDLHTANPTQGGTGGNNFLQTKDNTGITKDDIGFLEGAAVASLLSGEHMGLKHASHHHDNVKPLTRDDGVFRATSVGRLTAIGHTHAEGTQREHSELRQKQPEFPPLHSTTDVRGVRISQPSHLRQSDIVESQVPYLRQSSVTENQSSHVRQSGVTESKISHSRQSNVGDGQATVIEKADVMDSHAPQLRQPGVTHSQTENLRQSAVMDTQAPHLDQSGVTQNKTPHLRQSGMTESQTLHLRKSDVTKSETPHLRQSGVADSDSSKKFDDTTIYGSSNRQSHADAYLSHLKKLESELERHVSHIRDGTASFKKVEALSEGDSRPRTTGEDVSTFRQSGVVAKGVQTSRSHTNDEKVIISNFRDGTSRLTGSGQSSDARNEIRIRNQLSSTTEARNEEVQVFQSGQSGQVDAFQEKTQETSAPALPMSRIWRQQNNLLPIKASSSSGDDVKPQLIQRQNPEAWNSPSLRRPSQTTGDDRVLQSSRSQKTTFQDITAAPRAQTTFLTSPAVQTAPRRGTANLAQSRHQFDTLERSQSPLHVSVSSRDGRQRQVLPASRRLTNSHGQPAYTFHRSPDDGAFQENLFRHGDFYSSPRQPGRLREQQQVPFVHQEEKRADVSSRSREGISRGSFTGFSQAVRNVALTTNPDQRHRQQHHGGKSFWDPVDSSYKPVTQRGSKKFMDTLRNMNEGMEQETLIKSLSVLLRGEDFAGRWSIQDTSNQASQRPQDIQIPETGFTCKGLASGYYADTHDDARCNSFHFCGVDGTHTSYMCPTGTAFSQQLQVCDHAFRVKCRAPHRGDSQPHDHQQTSPDTSRKRDRFGKRVPSHNPYHLRQRA
ncbi:uncharacterized protein LOC123509478 [Portunus trituberculatus]|uniref:uncharacterized protein LOC123509478 n=1 Tax=Portunus trituberculatus TaxID=210409 RepID=UPI001E1CFA02|nr:uncharacterized protein LOC123509478 [Portunus trituberculatus]